MPPLPKLAPSAGRTLSELDNLVGCRSGHQRALEILGDAGCKVDTDKELVRFPNYLVEECLKKCPRRVLLKGRTPEYDVVVGDPYVHFASGIANRH